ncbi:MAG: hypothetical protein H7235_02885, partial [Bdellovibrionaceae bacterium]|nr:hypothetical protein [Pseudobdellovibrionaceae bacterium]
MKFKYEKLLQATFLIWPSLLIPRLVPVFDQFLLSKGESDLVIVFSILFLSLTPIRIASNILSRVVTIFHSKSEAEGNTLVRLNGGTMALSWISCIGFSLFSLGITGYMFGKSQVAWSDIVVTCLALSTIAGGLSLLNNVARFSLFTSHQEHNILKVDLGIAVIISILKYCYFFFFPADWTSIVAIMVLNLAEQILISLFFSRWMSFMPIWKELSHNFKRARNIIGTESVLMAIILIEPLAYAWTFSALGRADFLGTYT